MGARSEVVEPTAFEAVQSTFESYRPFHNWELA